MNWIIAFFVFGICSIFCLKNIKKTIKKIKRKISQKSFKSEIIEVQNLNDSTIESGNYQDVETAQ